MFEALEGRVPVRVPLPISISRPQPLQLHTGFLTHQSSPTLPVSLSLQTVGILGVVLGNFNLSLSGISSLIRRSGSTRCLLDPLRHFCYWTDQLLFSKGFRKHVLQGYSNQTISDPGASANSRPLSKLPFISKVLERVVVTQVTGPPTEKQSVLR